MSINGMEQEGEGTRLDTINGLLWAFEGANQSISTQTRRDGRAETAEQIGEYVYNMDRH